MKMSLNQLDKILKMQINKLNDKFNKHLFEKFKYKKIFVNIKFFYFKNYEFIYYNKLINIYKYRLKKLMADQEIK